MREETIIYTSLFESFDLYGESSLVGQVEI
jgi:hypothetical protein